MLLAFLDVGSNAANMLVTDLDPSKWGDLPMVAHAWKRRTRLAETLRLDGVVGMCCAGRLFGPAAESSPRTTVNRRNGRQEERGAGGAPMPSLENRCSETGRRAGTVVGRALTEPARPARHRGIRREVRLATLLTGLRCSRRQPRADRSWPPDTPCRTDHSGRGSAYGPGSRPPPASASG